MIGYNMLHHEDTNTRNRCFCRKKCLENSELCFSQPRFTFAIFR